MTQSPNALEIPDSSKHTPGPWKTHGGPAHPQRHHLAVIDSIPDVDGKIVANCICHLASTNPNSDANARLIAAAPELHDALQSIIFKASETLLEHGWIHEVENAVAALQKVSE